MQTHEDAASPLSPAALFVPAELIHPARRMRMRVLDNCCRILTRLLLHQGFWATCLFLFQPLLYRPFGICFRLLGRLDPVFS